MPNTDTAPLDWTLTDEETNALAVRIAALLDGLPIAEAQYVLKQAGGVITNAHVVDITSPRFRAAQAACG
jgi:hypothetical protein